MSTATEGDLVRAGRMGGDVIIGDVERSSFGELGDEKHPVRQLIAVAAPDLTLLAAASPRHG